MVMYEKTTTAYTGGHSDYGRRGKHGCNYYKR